LKKAQYVLSLHLRYFETNLSLVTPFHSSGLDVYVSIVREHDASVHLNARCNFSVGDNAQSASGQI
jgi:ABC-type uncharacterized transport system auxiliary subunit